MEKFHFPNKMSKILYEKGCYNVSLKLDFSLFSVVLEEIVSVSFTLLDIILTSLFAGV